MLFTKEKCLLMIPLLQAIVEGKTLQLKDTDTGKYFDVHDPYLQANLEDYRIKPSELKIKVRIYKNSDDELTTITEKSYNRFHKPFETYSFFKHWVGEWQEINVEQNNS